MKTLSGETRAVSELPAASEPGIEELPPGCRLFTEGELGSEVFLVEEGEVELRKVIDGVDRPVLVLGPGDFAGCESLDHPARRQLSAETRTACRLRRFDETSEDRARILDSRLRSRAQDMLLRCIERVDELMAEPPAAPEAEEPRSDNADSGPRAPAREVWPTVHGPDPSGVLSELPPPAAFSPDSEASVPGEDTTTQHDIEEIPRSPIFPSRGRRYFAWAGTLAVLVVIALVTVWMRAPGPDSAAADIGPEVPAPPAVDPTSEVVAAEKLPPPTLPAGAIDEVPRPPPAGVASATAPSPPAGDPSVLGRRDPRGELSPSAPSMARPEGTGDAGGSPPAARPAARKGEVSSAIATGEPVAATPSAPEPAPALRHTDRADVSTVPDSGPPPPSDSAGQPMAAPEPAARSEPELIPPQRLRSPALSYPIKARRLNKQADVRIRVLVDERGRVVEVEAPNPPIGYGFDKAAMAAARRSEFVPATRDGTPVAAWTVIDFEFRLQ